MTSRPFCNNLKKDDPVLDTVSNRPAKVARNPQTDQQRMVAVIFQGTTSSRYIDVMQLRLIVDGKSEDAAPVDGEPPPLPPAASHKIHRNDMTHVSTPGDPLALLKKQKSDHAAEIARMEERCREIRKEDERLDRAIAALEGK